MQIYMAQRGVADGPVKIGLSVNANSRIAALQVATPEELFVIRTIEGGPETEAWLHRYFQNSNISGEWFSFHPEMLTVTPPLFPPQPRSETGPVGINQLIHKHYGAFTNRRRRLAADAGSTDRSAENWLQDRCEPRISNIKHITDNNPAFRADLIAWLEDRA